MTTLLVPPSQSQDEEGKDSEESSLSMRVSIPMDVIETHIITKLPLKPLARLKCVCKYFNTLISSPEFIDLQYRRSISNKTNRLVILNIDSLGLHCYDYDSLGSPPFYIPFPTAFTKEMNRTVYTYGSCNGLLCLKNFTGELMLLNPSTGEFSEVPAFDVPGWFRNYGFGFDSLSNDYRVVAIVERYLRQVMVYSSKENCWRLIEGLTRPGVRGQIMENEKGVLIDNHLLHWVFWSTSKIVERLCIVCFDLQTQQWGKDIPLPECSEDEIQQPNKFTEELGVLDGCLCLLIPMKSDQWPEPVDVWVMKEYGVRESWVRLLSGVSHVSATQTLYMCPLGFRNDDNEEILLCRGRKHTKPIMGRVVLIWYKIKDRKSRLSDVHKVHGVTHFEEAYSFTQSLVPLIGGKRIQMDNQGERSEQGAQ